MFGFPCALCGRDIRTGTTLGNTTTTISCTSLWIVFGSPSALTNVIFKLLIFTGRRYLRQVDSSFNLEVWSSPGQVKLGIRAAESCHAVSLASETGPW